MCRVTGVPFNAVAWKKKKKFMAFLLWRAEETEVTLHLKTSLNPEHSSRIMRGCLFAVDILHEILNYTESQSTNVMSGCKCKANTNIWFHNVQFYKRSKFFYYLVSLHHLTV